MQPFQPLQGWIAGRLATSCSSNNKIGLRGARFIAESVARRSLGATSARRSVEIPCPKVQTSFRWLVHDVDAHMRGLVVVRECVRTLAGLLGCFLFGLLTSLLLWLLTCQRAFVLEPLLLFGLLTASPEGDPRNPLHACSRSCSQTMVHDASALADRS